MIVDRHASVRGAVGRVKPNPQEGSRAPDFSNVIPSPGTREEDDLADADRDRKDELHVGISLRSKSTRARFANIVWYYGYMYSICRASTLQFDWVARTAREFLRRAPGRS